MPTGAQIISPGNDWKDHLHRYVKHLGQTIQNLSVKTAPLKFYYYFPLFFGGTPNMSPKFSHNILVAF